MMGYPDGDRLCDRSVGYKVLWRVLGLLAVAAGVVGLLVQFGAQHRVIRLLAWIDTLGPWAPLVFIGVMVVVAVLLLPGFPFTVGAGFLFGLLAGTAYVVLGTTVGALFAFLIGRYCLKDRTETWLLSYPKVQSLRNTFSGKGWRIVLLTRLIPFFPFKLSNYVFGLLGFRLCGFTFGTFVGIIPLTLVNVYIGSMAARLTVAAARHGALSPLSWTAYGLGFIVAVLFVVYIGRTAQQALKEP